MKTSSPVWLAVYTSIVLTASAVILILILSSVLRMPFGWTYTGLFAAVLGVIQYMLFRYILNKFIYDRIKLIYKTIHSFKLSREAKKEKLLSLRGDILKEVNEEVIGWARDHTDEITRLRELETFRREFLGNVSHELKTPLFNLQGFTHTLLDGGLDDPGINRSYLDKMAGNIDRMINIVEELEVIARLETGEIKPVVHRFDVVALTREVFEFLGPKALKRNISLRLAHESQTPVWVIADKEQVRHVLVNLLENSIKYGNEGGRTKVSYYDMGDNLLTEVSDNGIGIEEEHLPRLFERFYRVDKHRSRSGGGSGLGLAIVKHIIEAHEQTVNVRSSPGIGSTFSFTLKKA